MQSTNAFFYQARDESAATQVDPHVLRESGDVHRRWLFGVLAELDRLLPDAGLRFWVTWEMNSFDERFRGAIAVVYDDEQLWTPLWGAAVPLVFKNSGVGREPLRWTAGLPAPLAWRMALRDTRNFAKHLKRSIQGHRIPGTQPPIHPIPLGASALLDVTTVPFAERTTDLFFAGSVGASGSFTVRPRVFARREMEAALEVIRATQPAIEIDYRVFGPFGVHFGEDAQILRTDDYLQRLARSKYALCPRGNVEETYRLFEATRVGCVPIGEPLPARWYFADCPYVKLRRWSQLPDAVRELSSDQSAAAAIAADAQRWWRERIAEPRIAEFMHEKIVAAGLAPGVVASAGR